MSAQFQPGDCVRYINEFEVEVFGIVLEMEFAHEITIASAEEDMQHVDVMKVMLVSRPVYPKPGEVVVTLNASEKDLVLRGLALLGSSLTSTEAFDLTAIFALANRVERDRAREAAK